MLFLTLLEEAQFHREVYIAALDGLLRERGDKRALAEAAGITPQYLSYLLADRPGATRRDPSPAVARRLAEALPLPPYERDLLAGHMALSNRRYLEAQRAAQHELRSSALIPPLVGDLHALYERANFGPAAETHRFAQRFVAQAALTLEHLFPAADPIAYAHLSLWAHDIEWALHRPTEALWRVKLARQAIEQFTTRRYCDGDRGPGDVLINAIRNEAVSYHNLGLFARAYRRCRQAEALLAHANAADRAHWLAHLYRDQLNALIGMPRYTLGEAEYLANGVVHACEADYYADRDKDLLTSLIHASLARAYVRYGGAPSLAKAERLLRYEYERLDRLTHFGPLHRVQVLRAHADLCWARRDRSGWAYWAGTALQTASAAGLAHQVYEIQREFAAPEGERAA